MDVQDSTSIKTFSAAAKSTKLQHVRLASAKVTVKIETFLLLFFVPNEMKEWKELPKVQICIGFMRYDCQHHSHGHTTRSP